MDVAQNEQADLAPKSGAQDTPPPRSIWRNGDFRALLLGQGISNIGDAVTATALPLLVLSLTRSGVQMGAVESLQAAGALAFGIMAGVLADRWDRRRILLTSSVGLAFLTGVIPLAAWSGWPMLPVIYLVALPLSMLGVLFGAAYTAAMPRLVGRELMGQANAYFEGLESFAWIVGPGVAGVLVGRIGSAPTLLLDAVSFIAGAAAIHLIRRPLQGERAAAEVPMRQQLKVGFSYIAHHRSLRALLLFWWALRIVAAPLIVVIAYHIKVDGGGSAATVGLALSAYAAGSLAGTLLAGRFGNRPAEAPVLIAAAIGGMAFLLLGRTTTLPLSMGGSALFGLTEGFILVIYLTARAHAVPDELLGRVGSTAATVSRGVGPIGLMAAGILLDRSGGGAALSVMGAATLGVCLLYSSTRALRGLRAEE